MAEEKQQTEMNKLLWGDKSLTTAQKIQAWAKWLIGFIILMTCLKILGVF